MGSYFTAHVASSDPVDWCRSRWTARCCVVLYAPKRQPRISCRCSPPCPIGARSTRCRRESNEIPCVRALLTLLPGSLRWLVTVDAMHTQVVTAKLICAP
ncbi:putative transposase for IS2404 [Mycobacterium ulcerans str. Harvey]|uniref:Transposase for IS2404 n=1 Tax=Mycobacterium ulcerans str. Harvey TaxID=1299332 RepID=A0ABP3AC58_MYCUL|nr:putative transposase for IS2404 [Mycobacterium ulcerans str. Harvey]